MGEECEIKRSEKGCKASERVSSGRPPELLLFLWSIITVLCLKMKNTFRAGGGEEPGSLERLINTRRMGL